jgi:lysophospholipase L1-like esterase
MMKHHRLYLPFSSTRLARRLLGAGAALLTFFAPLAPVSAQQVKIFANGDSITFGAGSSDGTVKSYGPVLASLLGANYTVQRDGVSGATLLKKGQPSYFNTQGVTNTIQANPDIITILLGTNDSKPSNWVYRDEFVADYLSLIDRYRALPSGPDVYPCLPPPAGELPGDIRGSVIANEVIPRILEAARQRGLQVIDLHTPFLDTLQSLFPDGIHPNDEGHRIMATRIRDAIIAGKSLRPLPGVWARTDVGAVGHMGADAVDESSVFYIWGGGASIGGNSDAFRFVHQSISDDFELMARVAVQRNVDPLVETRSDSAAGVMVREGNGVGARHVSVVATPDSGVSLRWRDAAGTSGGATTVSTLKQPVWVRLRRVGNTFTGYYSGNGSEWRQIGTPRTLALADTQVGLVANSGLPDELTQARFEQVQLLRTSSGDPTSGGDPRLRSARRAWAFDGAGTYRSDYRDETK